ncbi:MAG: substrate-binding domain-containing protein [Spirochaetales bacterium]|nr:substrate-binding domain-containing protein [Spirochaetales bacterium]
MKRIAFILDYLFYAATYQQEIVTGLASAAAAAAVKLYVFIGGPFLRDPYDPFLASRNGVYDLITREMFDGIIVCNSVANHASDEEIGRFLTRFEDIPIVFLGNSPPGFSRVEVDNVAAMADLTHHFIARHHHRSIAFITGPHGNREADDRFAAFRGELEKAGIPYAPELVVEGDFNVEGGRQAVRTLLDQRRVRFEALIASNDFMALGAKQELEERGLAIPDDVALAGFDDAMDASCIIPSLTTVKQPYDKIGKRALEELATIKASGRAGRTPRVHYIPAETMIRQSCGCFPRRADSGAVNYPGTENFGLDVYYMEHREDFIQRLESVFTADGGNGPRNEIGFLLDSAHDVIRQGTGVPAMLSMNKLISYCRAHRLNVKIGQEALTLVRRLFAPMLKSPEAIARAENFFHEARLAVSDLQDIEKNQDLLNSLKQTDQISEAGQVLLSTVGSTGLAGVIYRTFPLFSINNFLFAEYASPDASKARLVAMISDGRARRDLENSVYPPYRLFPSGVDWHDINVLFVLPVVYQEKGLGFVLFEKIGKENFLNTARQGDFAGGIFYEKIKSIQPIYLTLTRELAKSYYINRLIAMRMAAEDSLKALTIDLEFRNRELEDFAHIASHDLKEPLRKIVVFSDRLVQGKSGSGEADASDYLQRMRNAALRMNELIDGLLTYSRVTSGTKPMKRIDLTTVIAEVIQDLEVRINETKGRVEVGEMPIVSADPVQMRELFQNLIGNALKYHRNGVPPVVKVESERRDDFVVISVSDNGIGFDPMYQERIFGIFQRLVSKSEFEGTGVGLAICKKIVEKHNGAISADGEPGKGATFTIRLRADA